MAGNDVYLRIKSIPGEAKDVVFGDTIEIETFSFNCHIPRDLATLQAQGKVLMQPMTFVKHSDKATSPLLRALWQNEKIDKAELIVRKAGGRGQDYMHVILEDVYVNSFSINGGSGSEAPLPLETFQIAFSKITVQYAAQTDRGGLEGALVATRDMKIAQ